MQLQDKVVEDLEQARVESQQREDVEQRGEDTLPAPATEALVEANVKLRGELLGAIRMLLDGQPLAVGMLHLPARETQALEVLQVAVEGRSSLGQFVYAEDRRDMLEQALAVLQLNLSRVDDQTAHEMQAQFADLTSRVGVLRDTLTHLEEAQDDLMEGQRRGELAKDATEPSDKPKPPPSDPDAPRPATTLTGPERPAPATPPTTLVGTEPRESPRPPTTLTGSDRPEPPRPATTLTGPERPAPPTAASTLDGPELAPEPAPASSLGEPDDATQGKRPWWRRPFG